MATETQTPIETLRQYGKAQTIIGPPEYVARLQSVEDARAADARAALVEVEALVKELGEMPCWSPYEGAYFTGCGHRIPPRMDRHSFDTDDGRCRRCTALAKFQGQS